MLFRHLIGILAFIAIQPLCIYLSLCADAGRRLGWHEGSRLTLAITTEVLRGHWRNSRREGVIDTALAVAASRTDSTSSRLPALSMLQSSCWTVDVVTFADGEDMGRYYEEVLPQVGWFCVDRTPAGRCFESAEGDRVEILELPTTNPMMTTLRFVQAPARAP